LAVLEEELYKQIKDEGSRSLPKPDAFPHASKNQSLAANKATRKSHGPQSFQLDLSTNHLKGHSGAADKGQNGSEMSSEVAEG
jgi:hypothetical protein